MNPRVLIVGGGPVGLMMAILLARLGHRSIVIEKKLPRQSSAPKAHVLNPRSLEICRAAGLDVQAMRALAGHGDEGNCARFMSLLTGTEFGMLPFIAADASGRAEPSPTPLLNLAQPLFEDILLRHAQTLPEIEIRRGHAFLGCRQDTDGVTAEIASPQARYSETGAFLVAADGANSAVREFLGIGMDGMPAIRPRITIHFEADLRALVRDRPAVLYWILDPRAHGTFIAYDAGHTWVYTPRVAPEDYDRNDYTEAHCTALIHRAIGTDAVDVRIRHVVPWMMAAQVADRYRSDRCFLVGDAAHRFPPTGGLGLNTGIQDAHNLAWKLAAVMEGRAAADLLASYEAERRPVAQINTAQSLHNAQKLTGLFDLAGRALANGEASADDRAALREEVETHREHFLSEGLQLGFSYGPPVRGPADPQRYTPSLEPGARMPHAWFLSGGLRRSTLDLVDPSRFTLLCGAAQRAGWSAWMDELADTLCVSLPSDARFESPWLAEPLLRDGGALLLRPDGHIAAALTRRDDTARAQADEALAALGFRPIRTPA
jgi:2-polyprenyl-6-methoxyphenol hydroxylase-like FAD-dependent oxidoreductase